MATKPTAARGKTTRKGKIKKILKKLKPGMGKKLGPIAGAGIRGLMEKQPGKKRKLSPAKMPNQPNFMERGPRKVPNPRGEGTRMETGPRKMPDPRGRGTRMDKGPRKMTPLLRRALARKGK